MYNKFIIFHTFYTLEPIYVNGTEVYNLNNNTNAKKYTLKPEKGPKCIKNIGFDNLKKKLFFSIVRSAGKHSVGTGVTNETE